DAANVAAAALPVKARSAAAVSAPTQIRAPGEGDPSSSADRCAQDSEPLADGRAPGSDRGSSRAQQRVGRAEAVTDGAVGARRGPGLLQRLTGLLEGGQVRAALEHERIGG